MSFQSLLLWPENPGLSILLFAVVAMGFMYAARRPVHELLRALGHMIGGPLRIAARSLAQAAADIHQRNKAVLLAHGRQEVGSRVEREFERLAAIVTRDLQGYPTLQRKLLDEITSIEEDYKKCGEVPPPPPDWTEAVAAIANVKSTGNELVMRVLEEIKRSVSAIHDKALAEYRKCLRDAPQDPRGLHAVLALGRQEPDPGREEPGQPAVERAARVDAHMAKYEAINAGDRQGAARAHGLCVHTVRHRARGHDRRRGRRFHQLQADRAADVGDGGRGRLHHQLRCAPPKWRHWSSSSSRRRWVSSCWRRCASRISSRASPA